jgi:hypothetical protein
MSQKLKIFSGLTIVAAVLSLVLIIGCSDNLSVNPYHPDTIQSPTANVAGCRHTPRYTTSGDPIITEDSKVISIDEGGEISIVRDEYEHIFKVDPDAVDEDVEITIFSYEGKVWGKRAIIFEFGPSGLVFEEPAKLDFEMAELNNRADYARLFYYNPNYKSWILKSVKAVEQGEVEFEIDHFSKYAISD